MSDPNTVPGLLDQNAKERLESWKEIAAHLNRDVRTVQRWEKLERLPVHRHQHDKLGSVYAFRSEIDAWRDERQIRANPEAAQQDEPPEPELPPETAEDHTAPPVWRRRGVLVAVGVIVLAVVGFWFWRGQDSASQPQKVRLGVMPFKNLDDDPEQKYFSEGMTEEMVARLGSIHPERLGVVVLGSASEAVPIDELRKQYKLDYILEGTVRRADGRVRITAQLIQTKDQTRVWADSYERDLQDILRIQSDVATSIAGTIVVKLPPSTPARQVDPEAYEAYLKGRYFWNKRTPASLEKALTYFQAAVNKDDKYAPAYSGIADCYALLSSLPYTALLPRDGFPKAKAAAQKALELDDRAPEAHISMAYIRLVYDWNPAAAEYEIKRALEFNPESATAHQYYGYILVAQGRMDQAIEERQRAEALDPLSPVIAAAVGEVYYQARQYQRSIELNQKSLELDPAFGIAFVTQGRSRTQAGQHEEAQSDFRKALQVAPDDPALLACLGYDYALAGNAKDTRAVLAKLLQMRSKQYVPSVYIAAIYTGLGDRDHAFQWLDEAFRERCEYLVYLANDPMSDPLRSDPRFDAFMSRIWKAKYAN